MSASTRIYWRPVPDPALVSYQLYRANALAGQFWLLATLAADVLGQNYDASTGRFFFDDPAGGVDLYYQVTGLSVAGVVLGQSRPFQPSAVQDATIANLVRIDHNYGGQDALRYLTAGGDPVPQAQIRVYRAPDYAQGLTQTPYAILQTGDDGRWVSPVFLPPGMDYVVQFFKPSGYGPDVTTITV